MKTQVYNPFLPLHEYIPDGEPHVFGDRVYLFGSHDRERGETFCMLPYQVYSAPVDDLTNWTSPGISYDPRQDPMCDGNCSYLYAPDVVQGNDGRFYLYYCLSGAYGKGGYSNPIGVAVCDTPDGRYEYLGLVRDETGKPLMRYVCFDPAVINDNGIIRLYYGTCYPYDNDDKTPREQIYDLEAKLFDRPAEEIAQYPNGIMGAITVTLADDMLTATSAPVQIMPTRTVGTCFEEHPFFEGSSIRKVNGKYYFIYSSLQNHELCYAVSDFPDHDFVFGGTIISNGDVGYQGRKAEDRLNATGTTHGSIACVKGQWYVFYHRLTHATDYSRQACAEPIAIKPDGSIPQVEITSCGLNGKPLEAAGSYPAVICCNLTNGHMPHGSNQKIKEPIPCVFSDEQDRFVHRVSDGTWVGYKYFRFTGPMRLTVTLRGAGEGKLEICPSLHGAPLTELSVTAKEKWHEESVDVPFPVGDYALFFHYQGQGEIDILDFTFTPIP